MIIEPLRLRPEDARRILTFKAAVDFFFPAEGAFKWVMTQRY